MNNLCEVTMSAGGRQSGRQCTKVDPSVVSARFMSEQSATVILGSSVSIFDVAAVSRRSRPTMLNEGTIAALSKTRSQLEAAINDGQIIYGVNTGFGALSETLISSEALAPLQRNLLRSHAVGVGPRLPDDVTRSLLFLRAHTLALGASGVRPCVPQKLLEFLDANLIPEVPSQGSVGASGDLAPLAHLALPLIGEGYLCEGATRKPAAAVLAEAGITPLVLGPKEGLSLINGTQVTTAIAALATVDAFELMAAADIIGAMSLDAHLGTISTCDPRIHAGKPHPGQIQVANNIATLVAGSNLNQSHAGCGRVQDAYSLRCMPQVHGAVRQALSYVRTAIETELNSFTDNPLVLARADGGFDVVSGGNFHAATVALPADHATASLTSLATISERRIDRFMNPNSSRGLPAFLADNPGLESGLMMAHVTASALASECKSLSMPAAVDTIPTSAGKEDHVSMGPIAARKLASVVRNVAGVLAIEAVTAARAIDLREQPTSAPLQLVHSAIRRHVRPHEGDRSYTDEFEALTNAILRGELREACQVPGLNFSESRC